MELLDPNREWFFLDWMFLGLFLVAFSGAISTMIILVWDKLHPASITKLNTWLKNKGFDS